MSKKKKAVICVQINLFLIVENIKMYLNLRKIMKKYDKLTTNKISYNIEMFYKLHHPFCSLSCIMSTAPSKPSAPQSSI